MPREEPLLNISNLSVQSIGGRFRDLSLKGSRGHLLLITCADGRKIASLFRVLAGLESPLAGSIQYTGKNIGLILSEDELPAWSKIKHELVLHGKLNDIDPAVYSQLMESWDLEGTYNLPVELLSPYEKTAFFLVLETARTPDLLMCQEPLAGLNPKETKKMLANLQAYSGAGHLVILGSVNGDHYPGELARISLDKVQTLPAEETQPQAELFPEFSLGSYRPPHRSAETRIPQAERQPGGKSEGPAGSSQEFGGRKVVTVFVPLPVSPETDYELRRIGEIKYFEALGNGYGIDVLEADKNQLSVLLSDRGLKPLPSSGGEGPNSD